MVLQNGVMPRQAGFVFFLFDKECTTTSVQVELVHGYVVTELLACRVRAAQQQIPSDSIRLPIHLIQAIAGAESFYWRQIACPVQGTEALPCPCTWHCGTHKAECEA